MYQGAWQQLPRWWQGLPKTLQAGLCLLAVGWCTGLVRAVNVGNGLTVWLPWFFLPALAAASVASLWFAGIRSYEKDRWWILFFSIFLIGAKVAIIHSEGHSAQIFATVVGCAFLAFMLVLLRKGGWLAKVALTIFIMGIVFFGLYLYQAGVKSPNYARGQVWTTSAVLIGNNIVTGVGLQSFPAYYTQEVATLYTQPADLSVSESNSLYTAWWLNLGFLGLVGSLLVACTLLKMAWRRGFKAWLFAYPLLALLLYGFIATASFSLILSLLWWLFLLLLIPPQPLSPLDIQLE